MRIVLASALLGCAFSQGVLADAPGNTSTNVKQPVSQNWIDRVFDSAGDRDWFRVNLNRGSDYYVGVRCLSCSFRLRTYGGKILGQGFTTSDSGSQGFEVRGTYTGLFFLDVSDVPDGDSYPQGYQTIVSGDCPGGPITHCWVNPGQGHNGTLTDSQDVDSFWSNLTAGHSYTVTLNAGTESAVDALTVIDPNGGETHYYGLPTVSASFTATSSGSYRLVVSTDDDHQGGSYQVQVSP